MIHLKTYENYYKNNKEEFDLIINVDDISDEKLEEVQKYLFDSLPKHHWYKHMDYDYKPREILNIDDINKTFLSTGESYKISEGSDISFMVFFRQR